MPISIGNDEAIEVDVSADVGNVGGEQYVIVEDKDIPQSLESNIDPDTYSLWKST